MEIDWGDAVTIGVASGVASGGSILLTGTLRRWSERWVEKRNEDVVRYNLRLLEDFLSEINVHYERYKIRLWAFVDQVIPELEYEARARVEKVSVRLRKNDLISILEKIQVEAFHMTQGADGWGINFEDLDKDDPEWFKKWTAKRKKEIG